MKYITIPPPPHLAKYVRCFWILESDEPYLHRHYADGSAEVIFHYKGKFEEITDQDERLKALKALEARRLPIITSETMHLTSQWPFPSGEINKLAGIVFRIVIKDKTGRFEKSESEAFYAS